MGEGLRHGTTCAADRRGAGAGRGGYVELAAPHAGGVPVGRRARADSAARGPANHGPDAGHDQFHRGDLAAGRQHRRALALRGQRRRLRRAVSAGRARPAPGRLGPRRRVGSGAHDHGPRAGRRDAVLVCRAGSPFAGGRCPQHVVPLEQLGPRVDANDLHRVLERRRDGGRGRHQPASRSRPAPRPEPTSPSTTSSAPTRTRRPSMGTAATTAGARRARSPSPPAPPRGPLPSPSRTTAPSTTERKRRWW